MKVEYAPQYQCACIVIEPGDSADSVMEEAYAEGAICNWEGDDDFVVQFPGRPQEVYSESALRGSLHSSAHE